MNILFISSHINPFETPDGGSAQRTILLLRACAEIGDVDVVVFNKNAISNIKNCTVVYSDLPNYNHVKESRFHKFYRLLQPWNPYATFPKDKFKSEIIRHLISKKKYDYIVIRYIPKAMECGLLNNADRLVIDVDDSPSEALFALAKNAKTLRNRLWLIIISKNAKLHTIKILKKVCFSFYPNPSQIKDQKSAYLPNIPFYQDNIIPEIDFKKTGKQLLFVGDLDYFPNSLGIDYFLSHIYLQIQKRIPEVIFVIVGRISDENIKKKWNSFNGIRIVGFVDNVFTEYLKSRVVVVPIYHGAGTNIKLLEALQMNRACVASKFAARGFEKLLENKIDAFFAQNDTEFVEFVVELLTDEKKNKSTTINGKTKIERHFSYSIFSNIVKGTFGKLNEN